MGTDSHGSATSFSVFQNGFPQSTRGDTRRRLADKPPYHAPGTRQPSAQGLAVLSQPPSKPMTFSLEAARPSTSTLRA